MKDLVLREWDMTGSTRLDVDIRDLHFDARTGSLLVGTGGLGGLLSYDVTEGDTLSLVDVRFYTAGQAQQITGRIDSLSFGDQAYALVADTSRGYMTYVLDEAGEIGGGREIGAVAPDAGGIAACHVSEAGVVYLAGTGGSGFGVYDVTRLGGLDHVQTVRDTHVTHASDLAELVGVRLGGRDFVVSASAGEQALTSYVADPVTGALKACDALGASQGLGILNTITGVEAIETGAGQAFVVVASSASAGEMGALTVLRLGADGDLSVADHVFDTLDTRFGTAQALATCVVDDRAYVVAGGGDDGLSLFTVLPDGRLQHLSSLEGSAEANLFNISALEIVHTGTEVQVFAAAQGARGISQFTFSVEMQGETLRADAQGGILSGTARDDVLVGGRGADVLQGGTGDDVFQDGAGRDTLLGGAGADLFVMAADGEIDRIRDFDVAVDHIDLTGLAFLYGASQLDIRDTGLGVRIMWRGEILDVMPASGTTVTVDSVRAAVVSGPDRPPMLVLSEMVGTNAVDRIEGTDDRDAITGLSGNDAITGMAGDDTLRGGNGDDRLHSGSGNDEVLGGAGDDWIRLGMGHDVSRDGTGGNDTILADAGHDTVSAGDGADMVQGHAGNDHLSGGAGDDRLFGGDGSDRIWGGAGDDKVVGGNGRDLVFLGTGDDLFFDNAQDGLIGSDTIHAGAGNDRIEGGAGAELVVGGAGADTIRGRLGEDTLRGGMQDDIIHAGSGNDVVYGDKGRDTVHLGDGHDRFEDAEQGGTFGSDRIWGGAGNDTIESRGGADRLTGGAGADTFVFASTGGDRVVTDFDAARDVVHLEADRMSSRETDAGVELHWAEGSVLLAGLEMSDLGSGDILFV